MGVLPNDTLGSGSMYPKYRLLGHMDPEGICVSVIIRITPFRALITLLITYLLSPLPLQVSVMNPKP